MLLELVVDDRQAGDHDHHRSFPNMREGPLGSKAPRSGVRQADDIVKPLPLSKYSVLWAYQDSCAESRTCKAFACRKHRATG